MWPEEQQRGVFHQFECVDKINLDAQNPRRDTSIPSVSAGLDHPGSGKNTFTIVVCLEFVKKKKSAKDLYKAGFTYFL